MTPGTLPLDFYDLLTRVNIGNLESEMSTILKDRRLDIPSHLPSLDGVWDGEENKDYKGLVILQNGSTLIDRMISDRLVSPGRVYHEARLRDEDDALDYLTRFSGDGVLIYESATGDLYRGMNIISPEVSIEQKLPLDFVNPNPRQGYSFETMSRDVGNKTYLTLGLTDRYPDVTATGLKQSAYGRTRFGKNFLINKDGLSSERFFGYVRPDLLSDGTLSGIPQGQFDSLLEGIVMVERNYHPKEGGLMRKTPDSVIYENSIRTVAESYGQKRAINPEPQLGLLCPCPQYMN